MWQCNHSLTMVPGEAGRPGIAGSHNGTEPREQARPAPHPLKPTCLQVLEDLERAARKLDFLLGDFKMDLSNFTVPE